MIRWPLFLIAVLLSSPAFAQAALPMGIVADWAASPKLRWSPPALVNPTTIVLSGTPGVKTLNANTDYILQCSGELSGELTIQYGRNVTLIGCHINGRLNVKYSTGIFYGEGLWITPPAQTDGISSAGNVTSTGIIVLQNVRIDGLEGANTAPLYNHTDCWQGHGVQTGLRIDRMTCGNNYQGLLLDGQSAIGFVELSRVNLYDPGPANADGGNPSAGFWWLSSDQNNATKGNVPFRQECWRCYVRVRTGFNFSGKGYYPFAGITVGGVSVAPYTTDAGVSMCWTAPMQLRGERRKDGTCSTVTAGDPPDGDFVPLATVDGTYVSPGYLK
ncbi:MAG: hypothetical protein OSB00_15235 [Sphingomonas bacterium]|nr:hypothetical protein [Sphingomonas bacterium]